MGGQDGAVDHHVFIARVGGQRLKSPRQAAGLGPMAEVVVNILPGTETLRWIPPGNTSAVPMEHHFHEQTVDRRGYSERASGQARNS